MHGPQMGGAIWTRGGDQARCARNQAHLRILGLRRSDCVLARRAPAVICRYEVAVTDSAVSTLPLLVSDRKLLARDGRSKVRDPADYWSDQPASGTKPGVFMDASGYRPQARCTIARRSGLAVRCRTGAHRFVSSASRRLVGTERSGLHPVRSRHLQHAARPRHLRCALRQDCRTTARGLSVSLFSAARSAACRLTAVERSVSAPASGRIEALCDRGLCVPYDLIPSLTRLRNGG